jgi:hypothetical protein
MKPDYATMGMVLGAIIVLLQAALLVISIWDRLRRKPSIDQTLLDYVRRKEFTDHCRHNEDVTKELFTLLRDQTASMANNVTNMRKDLAEWQRAIAYQIGNLDGRVDKIERKPPR